MGVPNSLMKCSKLRQSHDKTSPTDALLDSTLFLFHTWNPLFDTVALETAKVYFIPLSKPKKNSFA